MIPSVVHYTYRLAKRLSGGADRKTFGECSYLSPIVIVKYGAIQTQSTVYGTLT